MVGDNVRIHLDRLYTVVGEDVRIHLDRLYTVVGEDVCTLVESC